MRVATAARSRRAISAWTDSPQTPPTGPLGGTEDRAYCSYLFAAGTQDVQLYPYWSLFGLSAPPVFDGAVIPLHSSATVPTSPNKAPTSMASISDGTSNTFLVGETDFKPAGVPSTSYGGVWAYGYIGYSWGTTFLPFNKHDNTSTVYGAFRSEHTAGASFALADGSVRFVRDGITKTTYDAYGSRAGGEVATLD